MPTNNYAWPYPTPTSSVDVPRDVKALAEAIDLTAKTAFNPPYCMLEQGTVQAAITSGGAAVITFDVEVSDPFGMHASGSPSRIVIPVAGLYLLAGLVNWSPNATGRRNSTWKVNGATQQWGGSVTIPAGVNNGVGIPAPTMLYRLNANDYVEMSAYQDSGVSLAPAVAAVGSAGRTYAMALWVAP